MYIYNYVCVCASVSMRFAYICLHGFTVQLCMRSVVLFLFSVFGWDSICVILRVLLNVYTRMFVFCTYDICV